MPLYRRPPATKRHALHTVWHPLYLPSQLLGAATQRGKLQASQGGTHLHKM